MSGRLRTFGIVAGTILLVVVGFVFLRGPKPHIEIKAETLWTIGFFEITNTLFTAWIIIAILVVVAILATRNMRYVPSGLQNVMEAIVEALYTLCVNTVGEKNGRRFFPVIATIFLYIIVSNWMGLTPLFNAVGKIEPIGAEEQHFFDAAFVFEDTGGFSAIMPGSKEIEFHVDEDQCAGMEGDRHEECLVRERKDAIAAAIEEADVPDDATVGVLAPYFRSVNTDLMSPLSIAIVSAIYVEFWGISSLGFFAYGSRFFNFRRLRQGNPMGVIDVAVGFLEIIAEFARLISFTFRLFGNMLAGEVLLLIMTFLIPLLIALPFYGLELFVGAVQAFVFAMLTLVFGALAVTSHDDHEETSHTNSGEVAAVHTAE